MTKPDPIIPKLLDIKQRDQETRLADITNEIRILQQKLQELMDEASRLDQRADGYDRMSVANGYLRYLDHRRSSIKERLNALQREADKAQSALRKTVFSQSMLQQSQGM
ncbi:MAG: hypothetical protein AAFZ74_03210 [Pseudomonadota bacterium]